MPLHSFVYFRQATLAFYDLEFEETGTYTASSLARGFSGSNDNFFTPEEFDTDPDIIENVASNGEFRWEVGGELTVTESQVGVRPEFRIGRREGLTEVDAIIFHESSNLTSIQLDTILASVPEPSSAALPFVAWLVLVVRGRRHQLRMTRGAGSGPP